MVAIGSFNLEARSAFLSTESMVVIHSEEVTEQFGKNIETYTDESLLVGEDYKYVENPNVEEREVNLLKVILIKVLAVPLRLFDYML